MSGLKTSGSDPTKEGSDASVPPGAALISVVAAAVRSRMKTLSTTEDEAATVAGAADTVGGLFVRSVATASKATFVPSGLIV